MTLLEVWVTLLLVLPVSVFICVRLGLKAVARDSQERKDQHNGSRRT